MYCKEINDYNKTWWGQLINNTMMTLGINNSWSGSTAGGSFSNAGYQPSRVNTLNENGDMNILIYYLGTNDLVNGHSDTEFRSAVTKTMEAVNKLCKTQIFVVT